MNLNLFTIILYFSSKHQKSHIKIRSRFTLDMIKVSLESLILQTRVYAKIILLKISKKPVFPCCCCSYV